MLAVVTTVTVVITVAVVMKVAGMTMERVAASHLLAFFAFCSGVRVGPILLEI